MNGDDVRFAETRGGMRLPAEPLLVHGVVGETRVEQFHRDGAFLGGVVGAIDLTHAAPAEQRVETIWPELRADPASCHDEQHKLPD